MGPCLHGLGCGEAGACGSLWSTAAVCSLHSVPSSLAQAITTPAMAVSHIMLESYKKYILVSLILLGKVQQLPKYTSQIVGRFIKVSFKMRLSSSTACAEGRGAWVCPAVVARSAA